MSDGMINYAWTGNTYIDDSFRFTDAMESSGHERIVFHRIGETDKLCAGDSTLIAGTFGCVLDYFAHLPHGIHVDAGARRSDVHRRT